MKHFFETVKQTFFSEELYKKAQIESGWKGIKFLVKFVLFVGIVVGIIGLVVLIMFTPMLKSNVVNFVQSMYPEGLVVKFADGVMTTNSEVPVIIPLPPAWINTDEPPVNNIPTNLLVLAPNDDASLENLEAYDTFAIAGKRALMAGFDGDFRTYAYSRDPQTITKESFIGMTDAFLRTASTVVYFILIPMVLLVTFTVAIDYLVWLLVTAFVLWLVYKIRHQNLTYKQVYKMGIYAFVPVFLTNIVAMPLGISSRILTAAIVIIIVLLSTHRVREESNG
jgi:hypothetical protein